MAKTKVTPGADLNPKKVSKVDQSKPTEKTGRGSTRSRSESRDSKKTEQKDKGRSKGNTKDLGDLSKKEKKEKEDLLDLNKKEKKVKESKLKKTEYTEESDEDLEMPHRGKKERWVRVIVSPNPSESLEHLKKRWLDLNKDRTRVMLTKDKTFWIHLKDQYESWRLGDFILKKWPKDYQLLSTKQMAHKQTYRDQGFKLILENENLPPRNLYGSQKKSEGERSEDPHLELRGKGDWLLEDFSKPKSKEELQGEVVKDIQNEILNGWSIALLTQKYHLEHNHERILILKQPGQLEKFLQLEEGWEKENPLPEKLKKQKRDQCQRRVDKMVEEAVAAEEGFSDSVDEEPTKKKHTEKDKPQSEAKGIDEEENLSKTAEEEFPSPQEENDYENRQDQQSILTEEYDSMIKTLGEYTELNPRIKNEDNVTYFESKKADFDDKISLFLTAASDKFGKESLSLKAIEKSLIEFSESFNILVFDYFLTKFSPSSWSACLQALTATDVDYSKFWEESKELMNQYADFFKAYFETRL